MKPRTFASVAVALVSMIGCNSLNTTVTVVALLPPAASPAAPAPQVPPEGAVWHPVVPLPPSNAPLVEPKKPDGSVQLCPVFRTPVLPKKPELPVKEIDAIGPHGDPFAIRRIEQRYIEDLHIYINQVNAALAKARAQYQLECKPYLKK